MYSKYLNCKVAVYVSNTVHWGACFIGVLTSEDSDSITLTSAMEYSSHTKLKSIIIKKSMINSIGEK